jgi:superfamily II DNA or RNA helicase
LPFAPPLERALLNKVFGKGPQTVPSAVLANNLGAILSRRYDVLGGDVRNSSQRADVSLKIDAVGDDAVLTARCGLAPISADSAIPVCQFRFMGSYFEVVEFTAPEICELRTLITNLKATEGDPGRFRMKANGKSLRELRAMADALPGTVLVIWAPELEAMAQRQPSIEPVLTLDRGRGWVDLHLGCKVNGVNVSVRDLARSLNDDNSMLRTADGVWLPLEPEDVQRCRSMLEASDLQFGTQRLSTVTAVSVLRQLDMPDVTVHQRSLSLAKELRAKEDVGAAELSAEIADGLRDYQRAGTDFLYNRTAYGVGCILADDMGLGKTRQVLAFLSSVLGGELRQSSCGPALVVCPASVVSVWQRETAEFVPDLRTVALTGSPEQRRKRLDKADETDIFVTTYATVRNDLEQLMATTFRAVILDEAQQIKNPRAQISAAVRRLTAQSRIAVTGTPLENRLLDLWSIMEFLNPGLLGSPDDLDSRWNTTRGRKLLTRRLAPLMLRRTKDEVAPELPPRTDELLTVPMSASQRAAYDSYMQQAREAKGQGNMAVLAALTRLRQICCHPALLDAQREDWSDERILADSAKLRWLMSQVRELVDEGHCALVFSQFTSMLEIIHQQLRKEEIRTFRITGETPAARRGKLVDEFQQADEPAVFLLSLKAAGTGLTLTRADYVFIYDPWWNPAAENQAIDRTHRIGQDKPVFAYRLAAEDSVESRVLALQEQKRELFTALIEGTESAASALSADDLAGLLA